jgi:hypothetical protein
MFRPFAPRKPEQSPAYQTPLWTVCEQLTGSFPWQSTNEIGFSEERTVSWSRAPYAYLLSEYTQPAEQTVLFHRVFSLIRLRSPRLDTNLHDFSRYMIIDGKLAAAIHTQLDKLPSKLTEEERAEMRSGYDFTVENEFYTPSAEDEIEVEFALRNAYLDGVTGNER